ncbi:MAG: N-acetylneuraminate synthase, partial [Candidatus Melainabacteria bacterium]|nr:N-acetylneuraminate synthase [Candidatus Melainabacteria bacterium]
LFKRPGNGLPPSSFEKIIGKTLIRDIVPDEQIKLIDIKK